MDSDQLARFLSEGLSLEQIGRRVGRHPSTIAHWLRKHGLSAVNRDLYAPKGGLQRDELEALVRAGETHRSIASALNVSTSTVQYWLRRHNLRTARRRGRHDIPADRPLRLDLVCPHHGTTTFIRRGDDGGYRCLKCRSEQVSKQRRRLKRILVLEAGGCCQLCGYDRCPSALRFHHLRPAHKRSPWARRGRIGPWSVPG